MGVCSLGRSLPLRVLRVLGVCRSRLSTPFVCRIGFPSFFDHTSPQRPFSLSFLPLLGPNTSVVCKMRISIPVLTPQDAFPIRSFPFLSVPFRSSPFLSIPFLSVPLRSTPVSLLCMFSFRFLPFPPVSFRFLPFASVSFPFPSRCFPVSFPFLPLRISRGSRPIPLPIPFPLPFPLTLSEPVCTTL